MRELQHQDVDPDPCQTIPHLSDRSPLQQGTAVNALDYHHDDGTEQTATSSPPLANQTDANGTEGIVG
jgi:hypothetical protein